MLLVYGLNTWLPSIMRKSGYALGPSLLFLVVFSLASAVGGLFLGRIADRIGAKRAVALLPRGRHRHLRADVPAFAAR